MSHTCRQGYSCLIGKKSEAHPFYSGSESPATCRLMPSRDRIFCIKLILYIVSYYFVQKGFGVLYVCLSA